MDKLYFLIYHYKDYIRSKTKDLVKKEKCSNCGSIDNLETHHKEYCLGSEYISILCRACHKKTTGLNRVRHGKAYEIENLTRNELIGLIKFEELKKELKEVKV